MDTQANRGQHGEDLCLDFVYLQDGKNFIVGRRLTGSKDEFEKVGVLKYKGLKVHVDRPARLDGKTEPEPVIPSKLSVTRGVTDGKATVWDGVKGTGY